MLEVRNMTKVFQDPKKKGAPVEALNNVSFKVEKGQFVSILGPSGCGKTTLLRIIAGLEKANGGEIYLDGNLIIGPGYERCMVFQNYGLLPWRTVIGNVEFGLEIQGVPKKKRREIAQREIDMLGLRGFEDSYPHEISGGMQQRVGLGRALTKDPSILLMDEPFAAVDMYTREFLQDELLKIWGTVRVTVLFVTHSIQEAIYLADRVIIMSPRPGRINDEVNVDLPRPRYATDVKGSVEFAELRHLVREKMIAIEEGISRINHNERVVVS